ncbi:nonsense-mediated mRNA decay protein 2 [Drosophila ananassae]|nr:nonsense-mediated mRNA decay protein 2 [Drosophila ananassae]
MFQLKTVYSFQQSLRVGPLILLLVLLALSPSEARWTKRPRRTTVPWGSTTPKTSHHQHVHHWPPLLAPPKPPQPPQAPTQVLPEVVYKPQSSPRLIDSFDQRSLDGQYEFRYQLDNGNTRYERAYWIPVGKELVLAKKGYYSVPLPNSQYSTVFYTADHRGYHVDMHTLSAEQPLLPKNLEVPGVPRQKDPETKKNIEPESEHSEQDVRVEEQEDTHEDKDLGHVPTTELYAETENETETEPSTLANDISATDKDDEDENVYDDIDDDDDDDGGDSK